MTSLFFLGGIYTAMITTVGGLCVGILAFFGYNYLTGRVSDVVFKMENTTIEFMDALTQSNEISSSVELYN